MALGGDPVEYGHEPRQVRRVLQDGERNAA